MELSKNSDYTDNSFLAQGQSYFGSDLQKPIGQISTKNRMPQYTSPQLLANSKRASTFARKSSSLLLQSTLPHQVVKEYRQSLKSKSPQILGSQKREFMTENFQLKTVTLQARKQKKNSSQAGSKSTKIVIAHKRSASENQNDYVAVKIQDSLMKPQKNDTLRLECESPLLQAGQHQMNSFEAAIKLPQVKLHHHYLSTEEDSQSDYDMHNSRGFKIISGLPTVIQNSRKNYPSNMHSTPTMLQSQKSFTANQMQEPLWEVQDAKEEADDMSGAAVRKKQLMRVEKIKSDFKQTIKQQTSITTAIDHEIEQLMKANYGTVTLFQTASGRANYQEVNLPKDMQIKKTDSSDKNPNEPSANYKNNSCSLPTLSKITIDNLNQKKGLSPNHLILDQPRPQLKHDFKLAIAKQVNTQKLSNQRRYRLQEQASILDTNNEAYSGQLLCLQGFNTMQKYSKPRKGQPKNDHLLNQKNLQTNFSSNFYDTGDGEKYDASTETFNCKRKETELLVTKSSSNLLNQLQTKGSQQQITEEEVAELHSCLPTTVYVSPTNRSSQKQLLNLQIVFPDEATQYLQDAKNQMKSSKNLLLQQSSLSKEQNTFSTEGTPKFRKTGVKYDAQKRFKHNLTTLKSTDILVPQNADQNYRAFIVQTLTPTFKFT